MFGVIKILTGGDFARLRYRLFPPEPVIERISVLGSAPFLLTLVCDENEEVDTGEIYSLLGRCGAGRVIVCGGTITERTKRLRILHLVSPSVMLIPRLII